MTHFIDIKYSINHPGVARLESVVEAFRQLQQGLSGTRGLAALMLSALVAAIMVVAYQLMDSVAEGHLLVMWTALWAVGFAALALFAGSARHLAARLKHGLDSWSRSLAESRADQRLWAAARSDSRVMADLLAATQRGQITSPEALASKPL